MQVKIVVEGLKIGLDGEDASLANINIESEMTLEELAALYEHQRAIIAEFMPRFDKLLNILEANATKGVVTE